MGKEEKSKQQQQELVSNIDELQALYWAHQVEQPIKYFLQPYKLGTMMSHLIDKMMKALKCLVTL
jgi:hypothetical protein